MPYSTRKLDDRVLFDCIERDNQRSVWLKRVEAGAESLAGERLKNDNRWHQVVNPNYFLDNGDQHGLVLPQGGWLDELRWDNLLEAIGVAERIVGAVKHIHQTGLIHRALNPSIFYVTDQHAIVIDLATVTQIRFIHTPWLPLPQNVSSLRCVAPELTGRSQAIGDARCDLYSLGVILYYWFAGAYPFTADSSARIVHQHLVVTPKRLNHINPQLPEVLAEVVARLLAKQPYQRYRDVDALLNDLVTVRQVVLGQRKDDISIISRLGFTSEIERVGSLYGRDNQLRQLEKKYSMSREGGTQGVFINGRSGLGKTSLVRNLYPQMTADNAFFISGKYEHSTSGVPYIGWLSAIESLAGYFKQMSSEQLTQWRAWLAEAMSDYLAAFLSWVPDIKSSLGFSDSTIATQQTNLPSSEAKQRLNETVRRLLSVFEYAERPLVIFLDDLQWADQASVELLEWILTQPSRAPVLLIGSVREDEVNSGHPLSIAIQEIERANVIPLKHIQLDELSVDDISLLLAEKVQHETRQFKQLADWLHKHSHGNPFMVWQLLKTLSQRGLLQYQLETGWRWRMDAIDELDQVDDIFSVIQLRFQLLQTDVQYLLAQAACIGVRFDMASLVRLTGKTPETILEQLLPAINDEFVVVEANIKSPILDESNMRFHFIHDRVQDVAHRTLDTSSRAKVHYQLGTHLLQQATAHPEVYSIRIVNHLYRGKQFIDTRVEQREFLGLVINAAKKAASAGAFAEALTIVHQGMHENPCLDDLWSVDPELAYQVYSERGELEYLNSNFERAEYFVRQAIGNTDSLLDKASLYTQWVQQATLNADYQKAVNVAREGLALFDVSLPEEAQLSTAALRCNVSDSLDSLSFNDLAHLPVLTDKTQQAILALLIAMGPPCYRAFPRLWSSVVIAQFKLISAYGANGATGYTLPAIGGLMVNHQLADSQQIKLLYDATERLTRKRGDTSAQSMGFLMMGSSLNHWFRAQRLASDDYMAAYRCGQQSGNLQYAVYGFGHDTYCRFFSGESLSELVPRVEHYLEYAMQRGNTWGIDLMTGALGVMYRLSGIGHFRGSFEQHVAQAEANHNHQVLAILSCMRLIEGLVGNDRIIVQKSLERCERYIEHISVQGLLPMAHWPGLRALALSQLEQLDTDSLNVAITRYQTWAEWQPDNFSHWLTLMRAEQARRQGDMPQTLEDYDAALRQAQKQGQWHTAAMIATRAQHYWQSKGHPGFASEYSSQRHHAMERWDAIELIHDSERKTRSTGYAMSMDVVIEIAQALSAFTEHEQLVSEVSRILVRQTGAQRLALLQCEDDELKLVMDVEHHLEKYFEPSVRLEHVNNLPTEMIRHVARVKKLQHINENTLTNRSWHNRAEDIKRNQLGEFSGSAVTVPLVYLGDLVGVLYLEHSRNRYAFNDRQMPIVEFIAAQAAISIRNLDLMRALAREGEARAEAEMRMRFADAEMASHDKVTKQLQHLANTDALTQLPNRRFFMSELQQSHDLFKRKGHQAAVVMMDIDSFKVINDRYGHSAGDEVLKALAKQFNHAVRMNDIAARIGGEEFALLIRDADMPQVLAIAERLRQAIELDSIVHSGEEVDYTVSIGISLFETQDDEFESILNRADRALYRAKSLGKNRVCHGAL